jgi:hypothetical protein
MIYEFPGFLLITRNNVITEIYRWVRLGPWQGYYHVLIYDDKVEFYSIDNVDFDGGNYKIDSRYIGKFEENMKESGILSKRWNKYAINDDNIISIEIENRSGRKILIISNGLNFGTEGTLENTEILENNEIYKYRINDLIFSLKYLSFRIRYIKGIYSESNHGNISYDFEQTDDDIILYNNNRQRNIKIIINHYDSGYEIKFP